MGLRPKPPHLQRGTRLDSLKDLHEIISYSVLYNLQNIGIQSVIRPLAWFKWGRFPHTPRWKLDGLFPVTVSYNNVTIEMAIPKIITHYHLGLPCVGTNRMVDCFRYIHSVGSVLFTAQARTQSLAETA
jgi:hypothetical protein